MGGKISIRKSARFALFRLIEWSTGVLKGHETKAPEHHLGEVNFAREDNFIWVFVSTLGELNAIRPFLIEFLDHRDTGNAVFLTDHPHYKDSILKIFPDAVIIDHGMEGRVESFIREFPPKCFFLAEIPCILSDAPCRFSYRVLYAMKKINVPCIVLNAWLYDGRPSCTMDRIEKRLLHNDYLDLIDLFTTQNEAVREGILAAGGSAQKVVVTGNIKFDVLDPGATLPHPQSDLNELIKVLRACGRPIITSGCVTNIAEQEYVLDAFKLVVTQAPDALLILAPRHPENIERMLKLAELLNERHLSHVFRTRQQSYDMSGINVLVLNTLGELIHMYEVAEVCFVGLNHNVLEPIALGKPVVVTSGWEESFPSYPVYVETKKHGLIYEADNRKHLAQLFLDLIQSSENDELQEAILSKIRVMQGATQRNLELVNEIIITHD